MWIPPESILISWKLGFCVCCKVVNLHSDKIHIQPIKDIHGMQNIMGVHKMQRELPPKIIKLLESPYFPARRTNKGRKPQNERSVPFKELIPLQLAPSVSSKGSRTSTAHCLPEMTQVFACFQLNNFSEPACLKEISEFHKCATEYRQNVTIRKENKRKGIMMKGTNNKLSPEEVNHMLEKFPNL